jgi:DNA-directed RNA polymerase subunit RPC12/RpoP
MIITLAVLYAGCALASLISIRTLMFLRYVSLNGGCARCGSRKLYHSRRTWYERVLMGSVVTAVRCARCGYRHLSAHRDVLTAQRSGLKDRDKLPAAAYSTVHFTGSLERLVTKLHAGTSDNAELLGFIPDRTRGAAASAAIHGCGQYPDVGPRNSVNAANTVERSGAD